MSLCINWQQQATYLRSKNCFVTELPVYVSRCASLTVFRFVLTSTVPLHTCTEQASLSRNDYKTSNQRLQ